MPKVPYPYEVNGKLVTGNGSLIPICSLSNRSLLPSLSVLSNFFFQYFWLFYAFLVRMTAYTLHIMRFPWHQEPKWPP